MSFFMKTKFDEKVLSGKLTRLHEVGYDSAAVSKAQKT